jgi:hypothetical protein
MRRAWWALPGIALATASVVVTAQSVARSSGDIPRMHDRRPNLQGMWSNNTATPLERLKEFAAKPFFTEAEARDYESHYLVDRAAAIFDDPFELEVGADFDVLDPGKVLSSGRTSLIVDPADGKVPALTADAQRRTRERTDRIRTRYAENPENFPNSERCLNVGNTAGPPMLPMFYNNNVQIVQTADYVLIHTEMIHDARVVSLRRTTHLPPQIRAWKGDSIGSWDGETLVVDTTNFTEATAFRGSGAALHVIERFSLGDRDTLNYAFTIDDP